MGSPGSNNNGNSSSAKVTVSRTKATQSWALREAQFEDGLVGGKSRKLAALRSLLPEQLALPASVALPFGSFERVLKEKPNSAAAKEVARLIQALERSAEGEVPPELAQLRAVSTTQLTAPDQLISEVRRTNFSTLCWAL